MTDHDATVAAVLELVMQKHLPLTLPEDDPKHPGWVMCMCHGFAPDAGPNLTLFRGPVLHRQHVAEKQKDALAAANYAVVKLPEGITVEHGARLVERHKEYSSRLGSLTLYAIEATP